MAERSVTRAAEKLGRTQSAVSHALARLREQLGDPLLVKARGGMQPSPFSIELIEQVRPTLRSVQRVLSPKRVFEPATAQRTFRLALPDVAPSLFPRLLARARKQAPAVALDWTSPRENTPRDVAEGHTDLALTPAILRMPDGVAADPVGALQWCCFARRGHPALRRWDLVAWTRWPHVVVGVGDRTSNPVSEAAAAAGAQRTVAASVPNFAAVAPLLAHSNLLATLPAIVMVDAAQRFDVTAMRVPLAIEPLPHALLWSARLANDPALVWLRDHLRCVIAETIAAAERAVRGRK